MICGKTLKRESGEGVRFAQLVERVEGVFDRATNERAASIATTESTRAYLAGNVQSAKDSGVVTGAKVLLSSDPCPLCEEIAAQGEKDLDSVWHTQPNFKQVALVANKLLATTVISNELLDDSIISLQELIKDLFVKACTWYLDPELRTRYGGQRPIYWYAFQCGNNQL